MRRTLAALLLAGAGLAQAQTAPPYIDTLDRPFNEYTWLTTHNAFNYALTPVPNQTVHMPEQLKAGVRGLMLDLVEQGDRIYVCHSLCLGGEDTLEQTLNQVVLPFLQSNREAVVSLHVEGDVGRSKLHRALNGVPGLASLTFKPADWGNDTWPTLRQMVDANQRLLIFHLNEQLSGDYNLDQGTAHIMASRHGTVENYWSLGATIFTHDYSCKTRWSDIPLDAATVSFPGKRWPRLFVMNQFHGVGESQHARLDNRFDKLWSRVTDNCAPVAKRKPSFIAVDHFQQGDGMALAALLTQGGVIFHEGNNASQDVVCGVPGRVSISANLTNGGFKGCENDEARSAELYALPAGTKITVYDSPSGSRSDDYAIITVKRNIGIRVIPTFEANTQDDEIKIEYFRKNGLDGKVSRIVVEPAP